jgi:HTH-type transcriptional regulator/antitoxin HigA
MHTVTYEQLLAEAVPARIETYEQYRDVGDRAAQLIRRARMRTPEETRLMRLLTVLIEDYDRRHSMPPDEALPAERLQFLMDHAGKVTADLLPVFGQRSHVNEALNGKRPISADQARKLGKMFSVNPGLFL